jgi:hypothetical protein
MVKPVFNIGKMNVPENKIKQNRGNRYFEQRFNNGPEYIFPVFRTYLILHFMDYCILDFCHRRKAKKKGKISLTATPKGLQMTTPMHNLSLTLSQSQLFVMFDEGCRVI